MKVSFVRTSSFIDLVILGHDTDSDSSHAEDVNEKLVNAFWERVIEVVGE